MSNNIIAPVLWMRCNLKQSPTHGSLMGVGYDLNVPVANNIYSYSLAISGFAPLTSEQAAISPPTTTQEAVEYYRRLTNLYAQSSYSIPFSTPQFMTVAPSGRQGIFWITAGGVCEGDWTVDRYGVPSGTFTPTDSGNPFPLDQVVLGRYFRFDALNMDDVMESTDTELTYNSHDFPYNPEEWGVATWLGGIPCFCGESNGGWNSATQQWEGWNPNEDFPPSVEISFTRSNPIDMVARFQLARTACVEKSWAKSNGNIHGGVHQNRLGTLNGSSPAPVAPTAGWGTYYEVDRRITQWPFGDTVDPGYAAVAGWSISPDELSNCIIRWQKGFLWHTKNKIEGGHTTYSMQPYFIVSVKVYLLDATEVTLIRQGTIQGGSLKVWQKVIGYGADESTGNVALPMPDAPTLPLPTGPRGGPLVACYYQAVIGVDPMLWALRNGYVLRFEGET